jgi:two-component system response regulator PilR (NtrC family)
LSPADLMLPAADLLPHAEVAEQPSTAPKAEPVGESVVNLPDDGIPPDLPAYLDAIEGNALRAALRKTGGNRTAAAQLLGITFRQFRYRLQRLGLK